jgi:hypothetical protein
MGCVCARMHARKTSLRGASCWVQRMRAHKCVSIPRGCIDAGTRRDLVCVLGVAELHKLPALQRKKHINAWLNGTCLVTQQVACLATQEWHKLPALQRILCL